MTLKRHENTISDSPIRAILTYTGDDCGNLGPRFLLQSQDFSEEAMPRDKLAEFLNKAADKNGDGSNRTISPEVEKALAEDFADVLSLQAGVYVYSGPATIAEFLNKAADKNGDGSNRTISPEVKKALAEDFADVLSLQAGVYVYSGPETISALLAFYSGLDIEKQPRKAAIYRGLDIKTEERFKDPKQAQAVEAINALLALKINPVGAKILDVGCGKGYHTKAMTEAGADVYTVEPSKQALMDAISLGNVDKRKAFSVTIQELPSELAGTFDVATVFCYCVPKVEYDAFMKGLAQSIKENGTVLIGIARREEQVFLHDKTASILPSVRKYFGDVETHTTSGFNTFILELSSPRNISKDVETQIKKTASKTHEAIQVGASPLVSERESKSWTEVMRKRESKSKESGVNHPW